MGHKVSIFLDFIKNIIDPYISPILVVGTIIWLVMHVVLCPI